MEAKYFYERLLGYDQEREETGKHYYAYCNGSVSVHIKGNEDEYYTIYADGNILKFDSSSDTCISKGKIGDLKGNKYELFSPVQICKVGYIIIKDEKPFPKAVISSIHNMITRMEDDLEETDNIPKLCGGSCWSKGLTDKISYYSTSGIEVELQTVYMICQENVNRKHYGAKCIPFDKSIDSKKAISVCFIITIHHDKDLLSGRLEKSLEELLGFVGDELGIDYEWREVKLSKNVYL